MKEQTLAKKQQVVDEIKEQLENCKSMVMVEYKGINVQDITELRQKFREGGVNYKVYKNTMVSRAFEDLGYEGLDEYLEGPNAYAFSVEDIVSGPKIVEEYAKDNEEKLIIKAGIVDGRVIGSEEVIALSKLPTKEVLLSMLMRALQGPITGLAQVSKATLSSLVYALNAVKEKKDEEAA